MAGSTYRIEMLEAMDLSNQVSKAALRKITAATRKQARKLAPRGGTRKDKAWMARKKKRLFASVVGSVSKKKGKQVGWVAARAPHAHLVTEGTAPHTTFTKKPHGRLVIKGHVVMSPVPHPGARPNPFLDEAMKDVRPQVPRLINNAVEEAAKKVTTKRTFTGSVPASPRR